MDHRNPPGVLVHLYRAAVAHADIWRQRLDATTNWAVITTAAALGYRTRRNYGPLMTLILLTWLLKLYIHPGVAAHLPDYVSRAHVGLVPGGAVLVDVGAFFVALILLALAAPSEHMKGWSSLPAPIERIKPGAWDPDAPGD